MSVIVRHYHGAPRPREITVARNAGDHTLSKKKKIAENHDEKIARLFPTAATHDEEARCWKINTDLNTFISQWQEPVAVYPSENSNEYTVFVTPYNSFGAR